MTSHSKAFGRSLPRDMQLSRSQLLSSTGASMLGDKPTQLWKVNDEKAGKNGNCQAVYWVQERPAQGPADRSHGAKAADKQWQTGSVYKGEWKSNKKHGYGIQIWSNGNKYEGEWAGGNREGHGVFWLKEKVGAAGKKSEEEKTSSSSYGGAANPTAATAAASKPGSAPSSDKKLRRVYAGNWKNDLKDGVGVYFYPDGSRYEGCWSCDVRCGRGTLYFTNGDSYTGEWKQNLQNGFGTLSRANADVYEGEWLNGMREGAGVYYYKQQEKIYDGEWVNDAPKCGVYCDAKEFFTDDAQAAAAAAGGGADGAAAAGSDGRILRRGRTLPIPRLRMADADGILASAIEQIGVARAAQRNLPHVQLRDLFDEASLDALRRLFARFDHDLDTGDGSGQVSLKLLHPMAAELALPKLDAPAFAQLCTDLRKKSNGKDKMNFQEFVRAVHLMEEAKNIAQAQAAAQGSDDE